MLLHVIQRMVHRYDKCFKIGKTKFKIQVTEFKIHEIVDREHSSFTICSENVVPFPSSFL